MLQVAPKVSAKKTAGISDYKRIRRGEEVVEKSKNIWVEVLDFKFISQDLAQYHVNVSSGFYVRSFARDIGKLIGISAVTESICRTSVGPFKIENAYDPVSNPREFLDIDNYDEPEFKNSIISKILSIEEICSSLDFERIEIIDEILIKQFQNGNPEAIKSLNLKSNAAIVFSQEKPLAIIKNDAGECSYSLVFS
jgi:tRNA U55 pseudouridine synthase TruB